jgi:propionyl-CoA carboxylase alpha chain
VHAAGGGWIDFTQERAGPGSAGGPADGADRIRRHVLSRGGRVWVQGPDGDVALAAVPRFPEVAADAVAGGLLAPMPGSVLAVHVAPGDTVAKGQVLVIVEAMKMEHRVCAPHDGMVTAVQARPGDQVSGGDLLAVIEQAP